MSKIPPFHLAFPVLDLEQARRFYRDVLGCTEGRSNTHWVDFNLYGHQIVAHLVPATSIDKPVFNPVDKHQVPIPHFGVVLEWNDWHDLAQRLLENDVEFVIEPYVRFFNQIGEQATLFFLDPSGNALEFKAFKDLRNLFEK